MPSLFRGFAVLVGVLAVMLSLLVRMDAQSEGENAIWSGSATAPSPAYIDAYPFYVTANDLCIAINNILTASSYPPTGAVIDARGVLGSPPGAAVACIENPFGGVTKPSTVLLPGATISISTEWILPSNTRIIGEGSGPQNYTAIGVTGSSFSGKAMIQMGPSSGSATGVVIEHLKLDGGGTLVFDGIDNVSAGDGSYVNDVDISRIGATSATPNISNTACTPTSINGAVTSLCIGPNATYSGPYTNLNITPSAVCSGYTCTNTACAKIQAQTRGLHGITCIGSAVLNQGTFTGPLAAIYLDSYNNTIENFHVEGFKDGIVVGDYADKQGGVLVPNGGSSISEVTGNTIANVVGANGGTASGPVINTVHICNQSASGACTSNTTMFVYNLVVSQALSLAATSGSATAIQDDTVSLTAGINPLGGPGYVGLYVLGASGTGYSRFTTNPATNTNTTVITPTWGVGSTPSPTTCTNNGAIYSNPAGSSGNKNTIFVCSGGSWLYLGS